MSASSTPVPHPLAERLIARYRNDGLTGPVLEIAAGNGRNTRAFIAAGIPIVALHDDDPYTQLPDGRDTFSAAISTHGYLHGTTAKLRAGMAELRRVLRRGAPLYLTLGSIDDDRFGFGEALDERTFAPGDGPEKGIPHAYFERAAIPELLTGFTIESLDEVDASTTRGAWAHPEAIAQPLTSVPTIETGADWLENTVGNLRGFRPKGENATDSLTDGVAETRGFRPKGENATDGGLNPKDSTATDSPERILHWFVVAKKN
jgi:hypothetical protein